MTEKKIDKESEIEKRRKGGEGAVERRKERLHAEWVLRSFPTKAAPLLS